MEQNIQISEALYNRLAAQVSGFETPEQVIDRILEFYENHNNSPTETTAIQYTSTPQKVKPPIKFIPDDEEEFKRLLVESKRAFIQIHKNNGTIEQKTWNAKHFSKDSNLRGNLWSGYLRGWDKKGICKAVLAIDEKDLGET